MSSSNSVAVKLAEVWPACRMTVAGTVSRVVSLEVNCDVMLLRRCRAGGYRAADRAGKLVRRERQAHAHRRRLVVMNVDRADVPVVSGDRGGDGHGLRPVRAARRR